MTKMKTQMRGNTVLHCAEMNKGTAFTEAERDALGITGLIPPRVVPMSIQLARVHEHLAHCQTDLDKYVYLAGLHDRNEALFFHLIMSDPAHFMPLVYTPTVGEACQKFGHEYRMPRGLFISIKHKGRIREILKNSGREDVRFIVVTDGERILGLGDLGADGMGIPIGKLALYTACAGVPPEVTLPITLDVGTNNESLLEDPLYIGTPEKRVRGEAYDAFIEEFVEAVQEEFPKCCIQFEDFANFHAVPILERYRNKVCCYNDDIQGTAAVAVAGLHAALRITGKPITEQTFLFLGAGSAGTGIADLICKAMAEEGLPMAKARRRCWLVDVNGLLVDSRTDLADFQKPFAHKHEPLTTFLEAVEAIKPTGIIGVSTVPKLFNRPVIEAMARINERPIIFPYSNPTSRSECTAEEAYTWSEGRAIFASGSPFDPVHFQDKTLIPGQGNNVYIFPAVGLAVYATEAKRVTDTMFLRAARALANQVSSASLDSGLIYPPQSDILRTSIAVAVEVAQQIFADGLAGVDKPDDIAAFVQSKVYQPEYREWV